jgi:hypothetical protein
MRHPWCQPGDVPERQWLLLFEDADRRELTIFTDEAEARAAFEQANVAWNCYLFVTAEREIDPAAQSRGA